MSSSEYCFPFDGTCELSKDADFTLTFDDNSSLKISRCLLELASPAFKTAIRDCEHDASLHLSGTSKDTWILMLNYIHPAGRFNERARELVNSRTRGIIDVLRQSQLHGLESIIQDLDNRIAITIYGWASEMEHWTSSFRHGFCPPCDFIQFHGHFVFHEAIKWFDMSQSEKAVVSHIMAVFKENANRLKVRLECKVKVDQNELKIGSHRILAFVSELRASGSYRLCSLLAEQMIKDRFCFNPSSMITDRP